MVVQLRASPGARARLVSSGSYLLKHTPWCTDRIRLQLIRQFRFLSSTGDSDECNSSELNNGKRVLQESVPSQPLTPGLSSAPSISLSAKKLDDIKRRQSSAPRLVPWTSNRFFKEYKVVKGASATPHGGSFVTMLRESTFVQLGNFAQREVIGVVIENVNDSDLYVDIGGKFLAVVSQPDNSFYPRGSLVRVRLRDPEMANRFMINTRGISLLEADATLLGPYRGQLIPAGSVATDTQVNKEVVSLEHWKLL